MDNKIKFQSKGEEIMWNHIQHINDSVDWRVIPHYYLPKQGFQYRAFADFALFYRDQLSIIIEVNGEGHYSPVFGQEKFEYTKQRDEDEARWCQENNIWLLIYDWINGDMYYNGKYWDLSDDIWDTMADVRNFGLRKH